MASSIHILTLPEERFDQSYMLYRLAECWREQGIRIHIGPAASVEADVGIVHVDRTWVPPECIPASGGRPLLNGQVLDISKRTVSRRLLKQDSDWQGRVIVKTNANFYGGPERQLRSPWHRERLFRRLTDVFSWQRLGVLPRGTYPVLDRLQQVPSWVWNREDLVVETFLPELEGDLYALRVWIFLGDREYSVRMFSRDPIVKASRIVSHEPLDQVPESLRQRRLELKMDYGKFDYVMVNGEAILLDANKTPTVAGGNKPSPRLVQLSKGIHGWISAAESQC